MEVQALLELHSPSLTPWSPNYSSSSLSSITNKDLHPQILKIAKQVYDSIPTIEEQPSGKGKVLWKDGAVGDPAALVLPLLLSASAGEEREGMIRAIERQVDFVLHDAPRVSPRVISLRLSGLAACAQGLKIDT